MQYAVSFLEGVITFLSPCLLPMLPVYLSYFAGGGTGGVGRTLTGALGFVLGFTAVFTSMGALAGSVGGLLRAHQAAVNAVSGLVVVLFGLSYLGVFQIGLFRGSGRRVSADRMGFLRAVLFGVVFSVGWTPCVGAFLGSALMLASQRGRAAEGMGMLLAYSLGLGLPFLLSAGLIGYLRSAFDWIRGHYRIIQLVSGGLLVLMGLLMATGVFGRLLGALS